MTAAPAPTTGQAAQLEAVRTRRWVLVGVCGLVLLTVGAVRLYVGPTDIGFPTGWAFWEVRLWRLALAAVAGASLAIAGVALQTLLRNPLAEPYILGLSTGAAAGMMAQSLLFSSLGWVVGGYHTGAVIGAAASMAVVFAIGRRHGVIDPLGLLLVGVVVSTINGALIMLANYLVGPGPARDSLMRWMMGYLNEGAEVIPVLIVVALLAAGWALLQRSASAMDVATLSDEEAQSLGVSLARLRTVLFVTASVLAAGAVLLAGPIAFVGLICPHLARLMLGPGHAPLLVASALLGGALVAAADVASAAMHLTWDVGLMPIGVFTALVGGPAFLWMLRPRLGRG
ncbi:MAG: iron ABC transporter permease [Phycisphaeraceae bacterium]